MTKERANFLIDRAWIIGIVDSYDAVHSRIYDFENADMHGDIWPMQNFNRWRWNSDDGFNTFSGDSLSVEHCDFIVRHIARKYGIKFHPEGYHDIKYLMKKAGRETRYVD